MAHIDGIVQHARNALARAYAAQDDYEMLFMYIHVDRDDPCNPQTVVQPSDYSEFEEFFTEHVGTPVPDGVMYRTRRCLNSSRKQILVVFSCGGRLWVYLVGDGTVFIANEKHKNIN